MLGNIRLKTSKSQSRLQRTAFTALLSAGRGAKSRPLFDDVDAGEETECEGRAPLFTAKRKLKWRGDGGCKWMDGQGKEVAVEVEIAAEVEEGKQERGGEEKEKQYKLVVTASMRRDMRDALVAMWVLRRWYAMAESRRARREGEFLIFNFNFNIYFLFLHFPFLSIFFCITCIVYLCALCMLTFDCSHGSPDAGGGVLFRYETCEEDWGAGCGWRGGLLMGIGILVQGDVSREEIFMFVMLVVVAVLELSNILTIGSRLWLGRLS